MTCTFLRPRRHWPAKVCDFLRQHGLQLPIMVRLSDPSAIIEFGRFSILPYRRQLLAEGRPIRLGGRAFDLLLALLEAPRGCGRQGRAVAPDLAGPDRRGKPAAERDFGSAQGLRSGPRPDPDGCRARLPIRWRDPRSLRGRTGEISYGYSSSGATPGGRKRPSIFALAG